MNYFYWINKHKRRNTQRPINGMSTGHPHNLQLPLYPRTLLIADVTRLQPFIVVGDAFRENIETLLSYNVRNDGAQQDCLYIEQGHLITPTTFMTHSMVIDLRRSVLCCSRAPHPCVRRDYHFLLLLKSLQLHL